MELGWESLDSQIKTGTNLCCFFSPFGFKFFLLRLSWSPSGWDSPIRNSAAPPCDRHIPLTTAPCQRPLPLPHQKKWKCIFLLFYPLFVFSVCGLVSWLRCSACSDTGAAAPTPRLTHHWSPHWRTSTVSTSCHVNEHKCISCFWGPPLPSPRRPMAAVTLN